MQEIFRLIAIKVSKGVGSPWAFVGALTMLTGWALLGPVFNYSDTWQLFINTFTTIMTFLTVFLIQNTQNRDAKAIHIKLDELLKGVRGARTEMVGAEELSEKELDHLLVEFHELHDKYTKAIIKKGGKVEISESLEIDK